MKHILAPVTGEVSGAAATLCALNMGRHLKAHVTGAFAAGSSLFHGPSFEPGPTPWDQEFYLSLKQVREGRRKSARRDFDAAVAKTMMPIATRPLCAQATTEWLDGVPGDGDPIGEVAPLADLVVLPAPGNRRNGDWDLVESVIFAARRPALIVPQGYSDITFSRPMIAWNGSLQAANAARVALDLFDADSKIVILQVGDLCAGGISADRVADNLGWHCFEAAKVQVDDAPHMTGAIILERAKTLNASVIVLGAYGHSRTRELILGGVTDFLLRGTTVPLLIAH